MVDVVAQLWNYCHTLRHDGVDYGDYIEQLTYLLFLKMAEERDMELPGDANWSTLRNAESIDVLETYDKALATLSTNSGMLGEIYLDARSKFTYARSLAQLVNLIDQINWSGLRVDVQAAAFEGLLEKAAAEGKKGAGVGWS